MAEELWNEIQNLDLGREEPELLIPFEAYAGVLNRNRISLIGRPLNPQNQNLRHVISTMPLIWGLSSRVHGRIIDDRFVQFLFQSASDMVTVIRRGPWLFNNWFMALQRWQDFPDEEYLILIYGFKLGEFLYLMSAPTLS